MQIVAHKHQKHWKIIIHKRHHQLSQAHALSPAQFQGNRLGTITDPQGNKSEQLKVKTSPDPPRQEQLGLAEQKEEEKEVFGHLEYREGKLV